MVWPIIAGLLAGGGGAAAGGAGAAAGGSGLLGGLFGKIMGGMSSFGGLLKDKIGAAAYNTMDAIPDKLYDDAETLYGNVTDPKRWGTIFKGQGEKDAKTPDKLPNMSLPQYPNPVSAPMSLEGFMNMAGGQQRQQRPRAPVNPIVSGYLKGLLGG